MLIRVKDLDILTILTTELQLEHFLTRIHTMVRHTILTNGGLPSCISPDRYFPRRPQV
ncbi:MAG TPA: hypothetical protein PLR74_06015 [Agriterribacter sp.]|nr:hypothetical protein [Agriterribacter sp.]